MYIVYRFYGRSSLCMRVGSPFVLLVAGAPDADKVHAYGPGIENGLLSTFVGQFVVETAGAGSGELTVKVRGPRGSFECSLSAS